MKTKDRDIREVLHLNIEETFKNDYDTIIIDELGLCQGESRIDIAVINGLIHGYEIKSESDTLERLPRQIEFYNRIFDTITIVCGKCHIDKIINEIPGWWGVVIAKNNNDNKVDLISIRENGINKNTDPYSIVQLLWKEEALDILMQYDLDKGYHNKSKKIIWERLVESLPIGELKYLVREKLKSRSNWRAGLLQMIYDG
ncbi:MULTISPECIES: sce7726 family protein [Tepidanaerobacter]|uniref:sce7726 family protein n=1 Tax=Tepidanaerobacter TaxID=499228 RepID=UPI001BD2CC85|nr:MULTISPECIES: sce7726 family protein [Tepidanaerobacter]